MSFADYVKKRRSGDVSAPKEVSAPKKEEQKPVETETGFAEYVKKRRTGEIKPSTYVPPVAGFDYAQGARRKQTNNIHAAAVEAYNAGKVDLSKIRPREGLNPNQTIGNASGVFTPATPEPANLTREGQWAAKHPIAGTGMYAVTNLVGGGEGVANAIDAAVRSATGKGKLKASEIKSAPLANAYRAGVSEGVRNYVETSDENLPKVLRTVGNIKQGDGQYSSGEQALDFLTGVGTDAASSALGMAMGGNMSTYLMGANAANQSLYDTANDEKTTSGQALALAAANGIAEAFFEKFSVENAGAVQEMFRRNPVSVKDFAKALVVSAGVEGSEEMNTEIANILSDMFIRGENSENGRMYANAVRNGADPNKAAAEVLRANLKQIGMAGLGGALSGGLHTGVFSAAGTMQRGMDLQNSFSAADIRDSLDTSTEEGQTAYKIASDLAEKEASGKRATAIDYGRLQNAIDNAVEAASVPTTEETVPTTEEAVPTTEEATEDVEIREVPRGDFRSSDAIRQTAENVKAQMDADYQEAFNEMYGADTEGIRNRGGDIEGTKENKRSYHIPVETLARVDEDNRNNKTYSGLGKYGQETFDTQSFGRDAYDSATSLYNSIRFGQDLTEAEKMRNARLLTDDQVFKVSQAAFKDLNSFYNWDRAGKISAMAEKHTLKDVTPGKVTYADGIDIDALRADGSEQARKKVAQMAYAEGLLSKVFGYNVHWIQSRIDDNTGRYIDENGYYDSSTHTISLDINAGANYVGDTIKYSTVIAHELTHTLELGAVEQYKKIADSVMNILVNDEEYSRGRNAQQIIADMIENNPHVHNESEAVHELVAQACEDMMSGNADIQEMLAGLNDSERQSLFDRISNAFASILKFIEDMLSSDAVKSDRREAEALRRAKDEIEGLQAVWNEGVKNAAIATKLADFGVVEGEGNVSVENSERSWSNTDKQKLLEALVEAGYDKKKAQKWIRDVSSISAMIAADRDRLDYVAAENQTMLKPNQEYIKTLDASTLCAKRQLYQGTYNAIQRMLPNTPLLSEEVIRIRGLLNEHGLESPCGICYVESRRRNLGRFASRWLNTYEGEYKPTIAEVTSTDGLENLRKTHPDTYADYIAAMKKKGVSNPKVVELRTDYRGEINNLTKGQIEKITRIGGLRVQSFSDFETVHTIDMMQAVLDMAANGLTAQAYTKVPAFAAIFGNTGIKINLSLIGDVDENGNLTFDDKEGIDHEEAFKLRKKYGKNVGTILVGRNDAHILAAMADPRIDFIIPFHRSGWGKRQFAQLGLDNYTDYTKSQNEKNLDGSKIKDGNLYPIDYWDYSKSGKENAERYLEICAEQGRIPKFSQFLTNNHDGSWSLKEDGSTDGYWKLLIDFKMYDNNGVGAPQEKVTGQFNMTEARKTLDSFDGNADSLPVAREVVDEFVKEFKEKHPRKQYSSRDLYEYDTSSPDMAADTGVQYSARITDEALLKKLNDEIARGDYIVTYKAMQLVGDNLYPPMAAKVKNEKGRYVWTNPSKLKAWQEAVEDPSNIKFKKNQDYGYYVLNKGDGSSVEAAYNPYEHSSNLVLNDQFEGAYKRDNLVVVKCYIPKSEIYGENRYKAQYAKDSTGVLDWKSGVVAGQLKDNKRQVYLSRYLMPVEIVPVEEVAKMWKETLEGSDVTVPFNVVQPSLLKELEKVGIPIDYEGSPMYKAHHKGESKQYSTRGNVTSRDSEGTELTKEQQEYFKDSKIRDADGNLQVMYHGTNADFTVFDTSVSGGVNGTAEGFGIYLADREEVSDAYGNRLIKAYANVTKPAASNKKTITRNTLKKLIKATAMFEAEKMVADGDYDNVNDAVKDSWISNYTNTYEKNLSGNLDDVANQLLRMDDNDMGIIQEVMAGMGIRDYADAYDFYDILKRVTGFDGFETWWNNSENKGDPARIVLAFDSNQVKNVENESPTDNPDIRYSTRDNTINGYTPSSIGSIEELMRYNSGIRDMSAGLAAALESKGAQGAKLSDAQVERIARKFIKEYGSEADPKKIAGGLKSMFDYIDMTSKVSASQLGKIAHDYAKEILKKATEENRFGNQYTDLKKGFKTANLKLTEELKGDIINTYGSVPNFKRQMRGILDISEKGTQGVDTYYEELKGLHPDLFTDDIINPADQLEKIAEVAELINQKRVKTDYGSDLDENAYVLGQEMVAQYFAEKGDSRYKREVDEIKAEMTKKHQAEMAELRADAAKEYQKLKDRLGSKAMRVAEVRAELNAMHRRVMERRELRLLTKDAKKRLMTQARKLSTIKGSREFESAKRELIGNLDLVSYGMSDGTRVNLEKLRRDAMAQAAQDEDYMKTVEYADIMKLTERLGKEKISEMSLEKILTLTKSVLALKNAQQTYNRMLKEDLGDYVAVYGRRLVAQQKNISGIRGKSHFLNALKKYSLYMENPVRAAHLLDGYQQDGVFTELFDDINQGAIKAEEFRQRSDKMFRPVLQDKELNRTWSKQDIPIEVNGQTYHISKGMRISIYLHSLNTDNKRHIKNGGFNIPDEKLYRQGRYTEAYAAGTHVPMDEATLNKIASEMTPAEKEFARVAKDFFNKTTKEAINEVSLQLKGYELAAVDKYFPIRTDPNFTQREIEGLVRDASIEGAGQFKNRVPGAKNPILLEDVAQVIQRQTNTTAQYYGLAIPVRNANKVWNYTSHAYQNSAKDAVAKNWLTDGAEIIENTLTDIQAGARRGDISRLFGFFKGAYAAAVLTANIGVSLKQSASYPLAIHMLDAASLAKGLKGKLDREYMDSITPLSWARRHGMGGQVEVADVFRQKGMIDENPALQWVKNATNWIQAVDVFTTDRLFVACEEYVKDHNPGLEVRGDEYNKMVADLYNDVLQRTQPSYGVMQRNERLRSSSEIRKAFTMFKTQTFNMGGELLDAGLRVQALSEMQKKGWVTKEEVNGAKRNMANVVGATILSQAMLAVLSTVANALLHKMKPYRDDEGEVTPESVIKKTAQDFATSFFGLFYGADFVSELATAMTGGKWYDVTAPQLDGINDATAAMSKWSEAVRKAFQGEGSRDELARQTGNMAIKISGAFGIPANNVYNMANAINLWVQDGRNRTLFESGESILGINDTGVTDKQYYNRMWDSLYVDKDWSKFITDYNRMVTMKDADTVNSKLVELLSETDEVKEAAAARRAGNAAAVKSAKERLGKWATGKAALAVLVDKAIDKAVKASEPKEEKDKDNEAWNGSDQLGKLSSDVATQWVQAGYDYDDFLAYKREYNDLNDRKKAELQKVRTEDQKKEISKKYSEMKREMAERAVRRSRVKKDDEILIWKAYGYQNAPSDKKK